MLKLSKLRRKKTERVKSRKHHYVEFKRHKKNGRNLRARWHRRQLRRDRKAVRKLNKMIEAQAKIVRAHKRVDWNGHPPLTGPAIRDAASTATSIPGLYITSTTDGTHSPTSHHYASRAFDGGSNDPGEGPEKRAQQRLLDEYGAHHFAELFGPLPWYVKNGVLIKGSVFPGHTDHLHVAV